MCITPPVLFVKKLPIFCIKTFSERTICISIPAYYQAGYESSMSRRQPYSDKVPPAVLYHKDNGNFPNDKTIAPPNLTIRQGFIY
ncbi:hypothetical protein [Bacteroides caccae]|uniref:hypothetical protein n=1 Tax=Bacteroides caccae TaxID=47678 RepID=UPI0015F651EB|nr:hypothetical protein [Bacteroides caccae]